MKAYEIFKTYHEIVECPTCGKESLVLITDDDQEVWAILCKECLNIEVLPI